MTNALRMWAAAPLLVLSAALVGCGGNGDGDGCKGPGATPESGSGTPSDPYIISLGVSYGGCAPALQDPGVFYAAVAPSDGTYTVTQTNGVTDLEINIYDGEGTYLDTIDEVYGGADESGSAFVTAGTYAFEVYNYGAAMGIGDQDGPFTLTVTGPAALP